MNRASRPSVCGAATGCEPICAAAAAACRIHSGTEAHRPIPPSGRRMAMRVLPCTWRHMPANFARPAAGRSASSAAFDDSAPTPGIFALFQFPHTDWVATALLGIPYTFSPALFQFTRRCQPW